MRVTSKNHEITTGMKEMSNQPIQVLLVEDNPADARLMQTILVEAKDVFINLELADRLSTGLERLS